ncbi:putative glycosyltransferase EpsH [Pedobacter glucosidilyticus]|nr:glycosyltransferase family 2 protein [Pedobacter glucosidilyticus]KHJ36978.1 putative glycosyltransferase EpsH [Pedobacter glucosidilyticus]
MYQYKVTVLIPTYNYAKYILQAIKSVESQSYPSSLIDILIIDDGSTDNTTDIVTSYKSSLPITYFYQQNLGKAAATKKGIELSKGDIIFNLDADDYFLPNKIETIIKIYNSNSSITFVGHPAIIEDEALNAKSEEIIPKNIIDKIIQGPELINFFLENRILFGGGSTFSAKTSSLKKNNISPDVDMYIDEYLIFTACLHGTAYISSGFLSTWRIHGKNYSVEKDKTILKIKGNRLLNSSFAMLEFINEEKDFNTRIKKLYYLKHLDRLYNTLEFNNEKDFKQIFRLLRIILSLKYSVKDIHAYNLFNRLLPTTIIKNLKSFWQLLKP